MSSTQPLLEKPEVQDIESQGPEKELTKEEDLTKYGLTKKEELVFNLFTYAVGHSIYFFVFLYALQCLSRDVEIAQTNVLLFLLMGDVNKLDYFSSFAGIDLVYTCFYSLSLFSLWCTLTLFVLILFDSLKLIELKKPHSKIHETVCFGVCLSVCSVAITSMLISETAFNNPNYFSHESRLWLVNMNTFSPYYTLKKQYILQSQYFIDHPKENTFIQFSSYINNRLHEILDEINNEYPFPLEEQKRMLEYEYSDTMLTKDKDLIYFLNT